MVYARIDDTLHRPESVCLFHGGLSTVLDFVHDYETWWTTEDLHDRATVGGEGPVVVVVEQPTKPVVTVTGNTTPKTDEDEDLLPEFRLHDFVANTGKRVARSGARMFIVKDATETASPRRLVADGLQVRVFNLARPFRRCRPSLESPW